jgi:hypothetical protein
MIRILCEPDVESIAQGISRAIDAEYDCQTAEIVSRNPAWNESPEWHDVLIVLFRGRPLPADFKEYIESFRNAHAVSDPVTGTQRPAGFVLPVATDSQTLQPPPPISGLKAVLYDGSADTAARLVRAVGVFLGMALRQGDHRIFISYKTSDGRDIAHDLHKRLMAEGFHPWLDEARENMSPGTEVDEAIRDNLKSAGMVLVVDTPQAPQSRWIKLEIDTALGDLIPVLPVVVGPDDVSRFIVLSSLKRRAPIKPNGVDGMPLTDVEWSKVLHEINELLFQAYQRRLRTVFHAERSFRSHGFDWIAIDLRRRMYRSNRPQPLMPQLTVLSHCSIHDISYVPALRAYARFIDGLPNRTELNQKVCVYERDQVLAEAEIETIREELQELPFILAHHNELGILLGSGFSRLR